MARDDISADFETRRRAIVAKYGRLRANGRPQFCVPSAAELGGKRKQGSGTDGKVIYPDRAAAQGAADELEALYGWPLQVFPCQRSRHGHFHLATDQPALRGGARREYREYRERS